MHIKILSITGAVALLSSTMLVVPEKAGAAPGVHAAVIYRAGRLLCYYRFGWRGPGYYPCPRPHPPVARSARFPRIASRPARVREPRASRVVELRRYRPGPDRGHKRPHPGGGHPIGGHPGGGGRTMVARPSLDRGGESMRGAPLAASRPATAPIRQGYGGNAGRGSFGGAYPGPAPMRVTPTGGGMRLGVPAGGPPMGGGVRMGGPTGALPASGSPRVGAPVGAPMAGAPAMHAPMPAAAAPAMHMPAAPMPAPAAAPAIHAPAAPAPAPVAAPPAAHH